MKDHFIPCLLLAGFSTDGRTGRNARVHQFNVDGPQPVRAKPVRKLAYAGHFYTQGGFPDLDKAGMHAKEDVAARLIRNLIDGADPQQHAGEIASLVALQGVRTRAFREGVAERVMTLQDKALDAFDTPAGLDRLRRLLDHEMEQFDVDSLVRQGIPRDAAAFAFSKLGEAGLRQVVENGITASSMSGVLEQMRSAMVGGDIANEWIKKAQVKGLHSMVASDGSEHTLDMARWVRLDSLDEPLILGDSCVVVVGEDGATGWIFKFGKHWREVYLPIGRHLALVGLAPDGPASPSLDAAALNRASAELARDYIYASRSTRVEEDLAALIGSAEPLITEASLDDVVGDAMREEPPDRASGSE
jgi:uncharacterized protein DUF4238